MLSKTTTPLKLMSSALVLLGALSACSSTEPEGTPQPTTTSDASPSGDRPDDASANTPDDADDDTVTSSSNPSGIVVADSEAPAGSPYRWQRYRHEGADYRCTLPDSGHQTFTVISPVEVADTDTLPMLVVVFGGAGGWWIKADAGGDHGYRESENSPGGTYNFTAAKSATEKSFAGVPSKVLEMGGLYRHLRENTKTNPYRLLVVDHCQQDMHFGLGQADESAHTPDPPAVTGMLAIFAAMDHARAHYETSNLAMYGLSAGAIAISGVSYVNSQLDSPLPIKGYIIDSGANTPYWQDVCNLKSGEGLLFCNHEARKPRLGKLYFDASTSLPARIEANEEQTPLYFVHNTFDDACHRGAPRDESGYGPDGSYNRCDLMMRPLHEAIQAHNPGGASHAYETCTGAECNVHGLATSGNLNRGQGPEDIGLALYSWLNERVTR